MVGEPSTANELLPELNLVADETRANQISQCCLVGKVQIHGLPLQFMTKDNVLKIGSLFEAVLSCELTSRTHLVGTKYMRIQVELDIRKPIPAGFFQRMVNGTVWIQFAYERMVDFCYNCGIIGHDKTSCKLPLLHNQLTNSNLYGEGTTRGEPHEHEAGFNSIDLVASESTQSLCRAGQDQAVDPIRETHVEEDSAMMTEHHDAPQPLPNKASVFKFQKPALGKRYDLRSRTMRK
ncbi:hypothetical protein FEM48_Zijuj06G0142500 [Ziziphus jujuba var. spinosa]|uniref:CCHC-type domain-containing protein n=1 Tax=Ziziphus jujuba var. spinosa TaxID=714518 RepID=A0A978V9R9_ZIZJJ|nr:hypothetical protein FEM48_Zijuj06G0142500 [Ziziphus jujuba var. spinosa]